MPKNDGTPKSAPDSEQIKSMIASARKNPSKTLAKEAAEVETKQETAPPVKKQRAPRALSAKRIAEQERTVLSSLLNATTIMNSVSEEWLEQTVTRVVQNKDKLTAAGKAQAFNAADRGTEIALKNPKVVLPKNWAELKTL